MSFAIPAALISASLGAQTTYNVARHSFAKPRPEKARPDVFEHKSVHWLPPQKLQLQRPHISEINFEPALYGFTAMLSFILVGAHIACGVPLMSMALSLGLTVGILYALTEAAGVKSWA